MLSSQIIKQVQQALAKRGFKPGPIDGDYGRLTIAAVKAFQIKEGLDVVYPGTIGPKTLAALGIIADPVDVKQIDIRPPWVVEGLRKLGLNEKLNNKTLREYLKSDGKTLGDPAKNPWCGDFQETIIAKTLPGEVIMSNPYWALNWMKFGVAVPKNIIPLGAIAPFKRPGGGHIGTVVGHDKTYFHVLGGNQSNAITIAKIAKSRLQGPLRWPKTYPLPTRSMPMTTFNGTITTNEA